ncbi:argininosuccinate lyase [Burkholderia sp. Leaf177]|uniref:lyase family protein n=1 Tax=Burkholderia sp. Leaf177 TaxID=1736287 RepID=UPI00070145A2|nr:lyase family protein [Burkholderia sp. Leaf177]KQR73621.1 argininosuccinate lyase [Burkholderia sp. Leaf177]
MRLHGWAFPAAVLLCAAPAFAQQNPPHDEFFWLGEINKATVVINTDEGLLDKSMAPRLAAGVAKVIADGNQPGAKRPKTVITFEPLLIKAAGEDITLLHAGRSSQDMHATYRSAILRDDLLDLADQLNQTTATIVRLADKYKATVVPNYTNGVAAQPNSYGHYLLGYVAGLDRDAQRIREAYARVDRSSMGTTVLNGTSWPLDRERMAKYLGFNAIVDNAYDASQISSVDEPVEAGAIVTSVGLHTGSFIQDVMTQYAESRPWILLQEGGANTYVSSAMPQKRNPGLLIRTRTDASTAISQAEGVVMLAHNLPPGMSDPKDVKANTEMIESGIAALKGWNEVMNSLVINPERALEELNSDWTASQEVADVLMRKYKLPFRVGHHFASTVVEFARQKDIKPLDFPYADAQRIYTQTVAGTPYAGDLPMSEAEFRSTLNPVAIVNNRATTGGPQPAEMARMLNDANKRVADQGKWIKDNRAHISSSLARLDTDFGKVSGQ